MLIYNAFPFAYQDIDHITHQLPSIRAMGFNIVWLNPIQNARRYTGCPGGSIYSMTDEYMFLSHWRGGDAASNEGALKYLSLCAKERGLTIMFDLVMNQVGQRLLKAVEHPHCFINASKGEFDYSTPEKQIEIFNIFFKPFNERYVKEYGFTGVRIDAAGMVPPFMQQMAINHFRMLCREHHRVEGVVLGEYLETNEKLKVLQDCGVKYDLITNSSYWTVNTSPYLDQSQRAAHNNDMWQRRQLSTYGTIGWTGNHDKETLYASCLKDFPKSTFDPHQRVNLEKMMREKIAANAFISDGGYYLLCGDEFGSNQRRNCFEWEGHEGEPALRPGQTYWEKWGGQFDLTSFIAQVNAARSLLSRDIDSSCWSEQYLVNTYLDPHHDLKCIVRNNGAGFSKPMDIILINVNPKEHSFKIGHSVILNIKEQIKNAHQDFDSNKRDLRIHLVGKIEMMENLPYEVLMNENITKQDLHQSRLR